MQMTWECVCGASLQLTMEQITSGVETCPKCGTPVRSVGHESGDALVSDTQLVSLAEMARMAQEGIDPSVSGEWDTSDPDNPKRD
jgi:hypothetical protein